MGELGLAEDILAFISPQLANASQLRLHACHAPFVSGVWGSRRTLQFRPLSSSPLIGLLLFFRLFQVLSIQRQSDLSQQSKLLWDLA
jgi:hypothetical protein